jgi:hypothetical protein
MLVVNRLLAKKQCRIYWWLFLCGNIKIISTDNFTITRLIFNCFPRKYMDVNEFETLSNLTLKHSVTYHRVVTRLTRRVPLVEQELPTRPEHPSSPPVFSGVRVTRSLVLRVCFVDGCLSFCTFSFDHCVVFSSLIYGFCLPLWFFKLFLSNFITSQAPLTMIRSTLLPFPGTRTYPIDGHFVISNSLYS